MEAGPKAIIIGGGIAGLTAAAAVLPHFASVTLYDRDDLTGSHIADETIAETTKRRRGIPQYTQPHALLAGGARAIDSLVPGFSEELEARGAVRYDPGLGFRVFDFGGPFVNGAEAGMQLLNASRRLINETLQDMVVRQAGDKLKICDSTSISALLWEEEMPNAFPSSAAARMGPPGIWGVVLASGERVKADLVIVCNGRRSQLPHWLKEGGVALPKPLKVDCRMNYASAWLRLPPDFNPDGKFYTAVTNGRPALSRGGVAIVVEDRILQVALTGFEGEAAPTEKEGWLEYAKSLPDPAIYELAQRSELLTPIARFASAPNFSCQYHKVALPAGLVVLGDAALALNPVYGQGMSVAAMGAVVLRGSLQKASAYGRKGDAAKRVAAIRAVGPKMQRQLQKSAGLAWDMSTSEDMRWPSVVLSEGVTKPPQMLYRYLDAIWLACQEDKKVWINMLRVSQFVAPPTAMFSPRMVCKAAKHMLLRRRRKVAVQVVSGREIGDAWGEEASPSSSSSLSSTTASQEKAAAAAELGGCGRTAEVVVA